MGLSREVARLPLSLSGGSTPNRHKADYNSSRSEEHSASARSKAIFKEALFEDGKDLKELLK